MVKQPKTIHAKQLNTIQMVAGNESKFGIVIDDGVLKEWVGIGWIDLRSATAEDVKKYPTVVRDPES